MWFQVLTGPDGSHPSYRFTILDANVVKEVGYLFSRGLDGIKASDQRKRLRHYLMAGPTFGERYAAVGALELARPETRAFDVDRMREALSRVEFIDSLSPDEWPYVLGGGVPAKLASSRNRNEFAEVEEMACIDAPSLVASISILTKAWLLAEARTPWQKALEELGQFCNETIRFNPGLPVITATCLVAGTTEKAQKFRSLLKFPGPGSDDERRSRTRSAAWDLHLLNSIIQIPLQSQMASGENLRPACALTGDGPLVKINGILSRHVQDSLDGVPGSSLKVRLPADVFRESQWDAIRRVYSLLDAGQISRRNDEAAYGQDARFTLFAAREYLRSTGDTAWDAFVDFADGGSKAWWNAHVPGHPSNAWASERGWV